MVGACLRICCRHRKSQAGHAPHLLQQRTELLIVVFFHTRCVSHSVMDRLRLRAMHERLRNAMLADARPPGCHVANCTPGTRCGLTSQFRSRIPRQCSTLRMQDAHTQHRVRCPASRSLQTDYP
jgi:hypothetical protein